MGVIDAAREIAGLLDRLSVSYAVIGGLAVQYWGEARTTADVDVVVLVADESLDELLTAVTAEFPARVPDVAQFARENRVLPVSASDGTPVDIALGIPGYEEQAVGRAVSAEFPGGGHARVLAPEDLIIHKLVAGRARDIEDVKRVLVRQSGKIDVEYVRGWLKEFEDIVVRDLAKAFDEVCQEAREDARG